MYAQTRKGSPQQRELARQRLRDCKGLEFAEKKKKQKENAEKEMRKGGSLKKAPFESRKNFRTLSPVIQRTHPK